MFGARKAVIATIVSLLFVTLLGMAVLAAGTPLNPGGPPHWYTLANEAALSGNWYVWLGNLAILLVPVAFYLAFAPAIARKALVNRTEPYIKKERTSYTPKSPLLALASAHFKGTTRSLTARVTLITTLAIPVIAKFTIHGASLEQTLIITLLAAGATTAVNSYAYDDTGTLMALSSPMKHREILLARTLATGLWVLTLAIPTTVGSLILGIRPSNGWGTFLLLVVLLVLVVVASGLMPTTKRPTATDHDSIRARPAPVPSTLGYALRAGLLVVTVVPLSVAGGDNGWVGIALVLGYVIFAYSRANHTAKDGAALTAAFRQ
jgi:hypothetical protein